MSMKNPTVAEWLNKKHLEWQIEKGTPQSAKAFAAYLDVKPTTYSSWVNGGIDPAGENLEKIARRLGYEIYDILGLPRPDPVDEIETLLGMLPPERGDQVVKLVTDWLTRHGITGPFDELDE